MREHIERNLFDMPTMEEIRQLKATALQLRRDALTALYHAGSGHPGGAMSMTEILTVLYFKRDEYPSRAA